MGVLRTSKKVAGRELLGGRGVASQPSILKDAHTDHLARSRLGLGGIGWVQTDSHSRKGGKAGNRGQRGGHRRAGRAEGDPG